MRRSFNIIILLLIFITGFSLESLAQPGLLRRIPRPGGGGGGGGKGDSLQHRTGLEDSITINFRFLDSTRMRKFDSSITDFTQRFPVPWYHYHLGNVGNATHSLLFPALMKPGWDHGFHAYDAYNFNDFDTRLYNTTRPYSEIQYQLGSRLEQILGLQHTQNILPNWNASLQYRMISAPGFFQNQKTNHNNYRFGSWYQSVNKRYQNFVVVTGNKLISGENGGIRDKVFLDSLPFNDRLTIPTNLGGSQVLNRNFFGTDVTTGTKYTNASYMLRQQYDIVGQKDSIVTDSSVIPLFYPRLRAEHTLNYKTYKYRFVDENPKDGFDYYHNNYNYADTLQNFFIQDHWRELVNDFSLYQYPDAKNSQQFIKVGAALQLLTGSFDSGAVTKKYHNFFVHGEYRNRSRNQKWDIEAFGNFYLNGLNAGDYNAHISLKRLISKKIGSLEIGFGNINRTPSFIFDSLSSFYLGDAASYAPFKKENNTEIFASMELPKPKLKLTGRYVLVSNYSYFKDFRQAAQYSTLFNVLQITAEKQFNLGGDWHWRTFVTLQQVTGSPPLNLPLIFTRNQIGYDGKLGFKNLQTSFGLEIRYYTPYKGDAYSALMGQFFNQNEETIKMEFPETAAYLHFRIKTFSAYVRLENLNAFSPANGGFTNNNIVSPLYPYPGMQLRIGIYWSFIN
jgi:hypothetical protein